MKPVFQGVPDLSGELYVAIAAALEAGAALRRHRASGLEVRHKARGEIVTAADLESDAIIRRRLARAFPGDGLYSEETADTAERLARARVWIVDPLDSTSNYASGGDQYSLSIGLAIAGRPALGVVYNPDREEMIAGWYGRGVTLNGQPVRVTNTRDLTAARVAVSSKEWQRGLAALTPQLTLIPQASFASKLARVAAGLEDAAFTLKCRKEWGSCAGVALVLAAGGRASLLDGSPITFNRPRPEQPMGMLAAGPSLYAPLLECLGALRPTTHQQEMTPA